MEFTHDQKMYVEIVQKAWEDANFKKELVADPVATIEKLIGQKLNLPVGKTLVVRDQSDESTVYINLPAASVVDAELSEEQLEAVAGGAPIIGIHDIVPLPWPFGGGAGGCFPTPNLDTF